MFVAFFADPLIVLPPLVHLVYSNGVQSFACNTILALLKSHNKRFDVICCLLDCLRYIEIHKNCLLKPNVNIRGLFNEPGVFHSSFAINVVGHTCTAYHAHFFLQFFLLWDWWMVVRKIILISYPKETNWLLHYDKLRNH